ncbi:MAG: multiheme c-type cytochrome [Planctomycetota bacterium]
MSKRRILILFALLPLVAAAGLLIWEMMRQHGTAMSTPIEAAQLTSHRPAVDLTDDYVSSDVCLSCHPRQHASWSASYHRTMTQLPLESTVRGSFSNTHLEFDGRSYDLQRRADQFWAVMNDPDQPLDPQSPQRTEVERPVALVTGSHHLQLYWYATGQSRVLGLLPVHYFLDEEQWLPARATLLRPPDEHFSSETGRWNQRCIQCHATHGRSRPQADGGLDSAVVEFGISCEACHGPGGEHVRRRQADPSAPDQTLVHPARLDHQRASEICGLCHSYTFAKSTTSELHELSHGFSYRPGQRLQDSLFLIRRDEASREHLRRFQVDPEVHFEERFWADGMVRVAGREFNGMSESACYQRGQMSCLSCHSMHQTSADERSPADWADRQLQPQMDSDQACLQCHDPQQYASSQHTHHADSSSGSRCYNCHLPHTTYGLLRVMRSHQIEIPRATTTKKTGRPNGCQLCHLDQTVEWTAGHLQAWYGHEIPEFSADEKQIAAAIRWTLAGDAGQRAVVGFNMGWKPAQEASGSDWLPPFLAQLMRDDYDVVRMVGYRSLRQTPGYEDIRFDFVAAPAQRQAVIDQVLQRWEQQQEERRARRGEASSELLLNAAGGLDRERFRRLNLLKNRRPVVLLE